MLLVCIWFQSWPFGIVLPISVFSHGKTIFLSFSAYILVDYIYLYGDEDCGLSSFTNMIDLTWAKQGQLAFLMFRLWSQLIVVTAKQATADFTERQEFPFSWVYGSQDRTRIVGHQCHYGTKSQNMESDKMSINR